MPDIADIKPPSPEVDGATRSFVKRWGHKNLFERGFLVVPTLFLQHYAHLKPHSLTPGEALFILHLMEFKWDANAPFPGYKTLATRMGVSDKMVRRYAQSLETKKYLRREIRVGQTNRFDLTLLFDALSVVAVQTKKQTARKTKRIGKRTLEAWDAWTGKMLDAYNSMSEEEREDLRQWQQAQSNGRARGTSNWPGWERHIGKKPTQITNAI